MSYRVCAEMISKMTGLSISGVGVWNIVQKLGEEIKQYEKEKVKKVYTFKQGSLEGYHNLKKILENKTISELVYR